MDVFALAVSLTLNTEGFGQSLNTAGERTAAFADKLKRGLSAAAKEGARALGALTRSALEGYADYEQLAGGVETLFKTSAGAVLEYANNAYKTAGLSANQYMETVTSFSASLLQSLSGDTEAAARYADMAITDMADNANKMGTDIEMLQNAYRGFARGNFTMLDNLALGYAGTKEEMERLLADAERLSGVHYDISSYADMVAAIHEVQTELEISGLSAEEAAAAVASGAMTQEEAFAAMGTTAKEAATTIQGSLSAAKAAWANLMTGLGDENADLDGLIANFVDSVDTAGGNILPRVEQILAGIGAAVQELSPILQEQLPILLETLMPSLIQTGAAFTAALLSGLAGAIVENAPLLWAAALQILDELGNALAQQLPGLSLVFENLETVVLAVTAGFIAFKAAAAIGGAIEMVKTGMEALRVATKAQADAQVSANTAMLASPIMLVVTLIATLVTALITLYMTNEDFRNKVNAAWTAVKDTIAGVVSGVVEFFTQTVPDAGRAMLEFFTSLPGKALQWGKDLIDNFVQGIKDTIGKVKDAVVGVADTVRSFLGFSEPEEGPLSNFHTYAPDMMELFAKGIRQNAGQLKAAFNDTLELLPAAQLPLAQTAQLVPAQPAAGAPGGAYRGGRGPWAGGDTFQITVNGAQWPDLPAAAEYIAGEIQRMEERKRSAYGIA